MSFRVLHRRQQLREPTLASLTLPTLSIPIPTLPGATSQGRSTTISSSTAKSSSVVSSSSSRVVSSTSMSSSSTSYPFNKSSLAPVHTSTPTHVASSTIVPSSSSAQPSNTSSPSNTGSITRAVVGGAFAAIIGIAVLACAIMFFMRRSRKRRDQEAFDAGSFRRSAVLLPEHTHERGFGLRPPTMIERKLANTPPASPSPWAQQFNMAYPYGQTSETVEQRQHGPEQGYGNVNAQYHPSVGPGQVLASAAPPTPNSAAALLPPATQEQSPFSPIASPIAAPSILPDQSVRQSSNGDFIQRQSSGAALSRQPSDPDYIDLSRSSISPFQARQYAEISRTLNVDVPIPVPEPYKSDKKSSSDELPTSFEEPSDPAPPYKERQSTAIGEDKDKKESPFTDPVPQVPEKHDIVTASDHDDSVASRPRITSIPPILPEIGLQQRTFSPTPFSSAFNSVLSPIQPHAFGKNDPFATTSNDQPKRPVSAYMTDDPNDAYGGI